MQPAERLDPKCLPVGRCLTTNYANSRHVYILLDTLTEISDSMLGSDASFATCVAGRFDIFCTNVVLAAGSDLVRVVKCFVFTHSCFNLNSCDHRIP